MQIKIREAKPADFERLEEILEQNNMLSSPEIDGKEAMKEISKRMGNYFLVAELSDDFVVGMARGCYDGSRALIHQMAVDKKYHKCGIGKRLLCEIASRFKSDGAKSISVTSTEKARSYYGHLGFSELPIALMVCFDINDVIKTARQGN